MQDDQLAEGDGTTMNLKPKPAPSYINRCCASTINDTTNKYRFPSAFVRPGKMRLLRALSGVQSQIHRYNSQCCASKTKDTANNFRFISVPVRLGEMA